MGPAALPCVGVGLGLWRCFVSRLVLGLDSSVVSGFVLVRFGLSCGVWFVPPRGRLLAAG